MDDTPLGVLLQDETAKLVNLLRVEVEMWTRSRTSADDWRLTVGVDGASLTVHFDIQPRHQREPMAGDS